MIVWATLWLIRERAMKCITPDGRVILADCQALADVLYTQIPGEWQLTITRIPIAAQDSQDNET